MILSLLAPAAVAPRPCLAYDLLEPLPPIAVPGGGPIAVAASGDRVFALDAKKSALLIFDASGRLLKTVGGRGPGRGRFSSPSGLAAGPDGEVVVADTGNNRVQVFGPDGAFLAAFGGAGSEPGRMKGPRSVALGAYGRILVADTGNARVQAFTKEGVLLFTIGGKGKEPGRFKEPVRVAVDPSDAVYVLDPAAGRVQKFGPDAKLAGAWPLSADEMDVDEYGFLYALDSGKGKVSEYGPDRRLLGGFGTNGSGPGQFRRASGVAVGPDGVVFVADTGNSRIQRVRLTSKHKVERLRQSPETTLLVSPARAWNLQASAIAGLGDSLYAYLPKPRRFVVLGADGKEAGRFGGKTGKAESETKECRGLAASEKGVFAADPSAGRVQAFDRAGKFLASFGQSTGMFDSAKKEGRVKAPVAVAVNEAGTVYVADEATRRVSAFSPNGSYLFGFGPKIGSLQLAKPAAIAFDPAGFVFLLDAKLKKVLKLEPSGGFVAAWGEDGRAPGRFDDPVAIACDGRAYVYVLDRGNARVSAFTRDGRWVTDFLSKGNDDRSLAEPEALAVAGGALVVSDPARARLLSFSLRPRLAPPAAVSTGTLEGVAMLSWEASSDPWLARYAVLRATQPFGPYVEVGRTAASKFRDDSVEPGRWFYRVAAVSQPGEAGPLSPRAEVVVAEASNRPPVEISTLTVGNIFPARYKWYLKNPLGSAVVVNNVDVAFRNVAVSFRLKDFMDFPTERVLAAVGPGQKVEVPLLATLNNRILEVTEETPIQAEVAVTYFEKGEKKSFSRALPIRVYARNAITWDDPRRIASFITPNDPPVFLLGSGILQRAGQPAGPAARLNPSLLRAIQLWEGLGGMGFKFAPSANNPFEKMMEDPAYPVDYTQFPRDTVRRRAGQCDDLVTLYSSLLEGARVHAAVLDYPGHVAVMLDTGLEDPAEVGLPAEQLIEHKGTLWIPVEATKVGVPFDEAHRKALEDYREMAKAGKAAVIDPRDVVDVYEPATLPAGDDKTEAPTEEQMSARLRAPLEVYSRQRLEFLRRHWGDLAAAHPDDPLLANKLGILLAQQGLYAEAEGELAKDLARFPGNADLLNNLGNLAFVQGRYEEAEKRYSGAAKADPSDPGVWMNLVRACVSLGRKEKAAEFGAKAVALDKDLKADLYALMK